METLDKRIAGDWYDIRQIIDDRRALEAYLNLAESELKELTEGLRLSVERGTVELKRKNLGSVFSFVDSQQFDARSFQDIGRQIRELLKLTYLSLLQRAYCTGNLAPRRPAAAEGDSVEDFVKQTEFKTILENIRERIARDQGLASNPTVKNILMQVRKYRREVANMKELAPNIPKEKFAAFSENFKRSFEDITRKARESYAEFLRAEGGTPPERARNMFQRYDLKPLGGLFAVQAQEFSRIRSILAHAEKERYMIREILAEVLRMRDRVLSLVDREIKEYERLAFGHGEEMAREFATELAEYLGRRLSSPAVEE